MTQEPLHTIDLEEYVTAGLRLMTGHNINQVLVIEEGKLVGLLNRVHVILYIQGMQEPGITPNSAPDASQRTVSKTYNKGKTEGLEPDKCLT